MLSVDKHFFRPPGREEESDLKREKFQVRDAGSFSLPRQLTSCGVVARYQRAII
jgi:hypothetical protein